MEQRTQKHWTVRPPLVIAVLLVTSVLLWFNVTHHAWVLVPFNVGVIVIELYVLFFAR